MAVLNFPLVAGSEDLYVRLLPWLLVVAVVRGLGYAAYPKARRPAVYAGLQDDLEKYDETLND